jgi:hypothetical protein
MSYLEVDKKKRIRLASHTTSKITNQIHYITLIEDSFFWVSGRTRVNKYGMNGVHFWVGKPYGVHNLARLCGLTVITIFLSSLYKGWSLETGSMMANLLWERKEWPLRGDHNLEAVKNKHNKDKIQSMVNFDRPSTDDKGLHSNRHSV